MGCDSQFDPPTKQKESAASRPGEVMWGAPTRQVLVKDSGPKVETTVFPPDQFSGTAARTLEIISFGDPVAQPGPFIDRVHEKEDPKQDTRPVLTYFERELRFLINRFSMENQSNTPDFILAEYLSGCLNAFNYAVQRRA